MVGRMKFGFQILTYGSSWDDVLATVRRLESLGYDYVFGHDHLYSTGGNPYQPFFEGWTTLAAWAQATDRISLGLTVGNNTFRNPGGVAKMATTIDHISGGRSVLGLGAGNVELEVVAHGLAWASTGVRLDRLEEALELIRAVVDGKTVDHVGPTYTFRAVRHAPLPRRRPLPFLVGAEGERKGLRVAARFADIWQIFVPIDGFEFWSHKDDVFRLHCRELERDHSTVERMIGCKLVLRSDPADARRAFEDLRVVHGWGESVWDVVWATSPALAAEALVGFAALGVSSFLPQLAWPYDTETIERLIGEVAPLVASSMA